VFIILLGSTLTDFAPAGAANSEISGRVLALANLANDFYKTQRLNKRIIVYLDILVPEVLNSGLNFIISEKVDGIPGGV
jgi:hypothetical protein